MRTQTFRSCYRKSRQRHVDQLIVAAVLLGLQILAVPQRILPETVSSPGPMS